MQCFNQQVFAERYRMKFIIKEEVGVTACTTDDSEMEDEEDEVSQLKMTTLFHVEDPSNVIEFESCQFCHRMRMSSRMPRRSSSWTSPVSCTRPSWRPSSRRRTMTILKRALLRSWRRTLPLGQLVLEPNRLVNCERKGYIN